MPDKPIAILFANLKSNIGDFAILHAMLADIGRSYPESDIHVYTHGSYDVDAARLAAFRERCDVSFSVTGRTYAEQPRPRVLDRVARAAGIWPLVQHRRIQALSRSAHADAARFKDYQAVFIAGGALWSSVQSGIAMFGTLQAVAKHNADIRVYPFSVQPALLKLNRSTDLQDYFGLLQASLLVRDSYSQSLLQRAGVEADLGADCVYSLGSVVEEVSPRSGDRGQILVSLTKDTEHFENKLASAVERLGTFRGRIKLMTTCATEDAHSMYALAEKLGLSAVAPLTWQEAVSEIKASALFITNRLHGLILGTLSDAALVPATSRTKARSFAVDADLPCRLEAISDLSDAMIAEWLAQREAILERVRVHKQRSLSAVSSPISAQATVP